MPSVSAEAREEAQILAAAEEKRALAAQQEMAMGRREIASQRLQELESDAMGGEVVECVVRCPDGSR